MDKVLIPTYLWYNVLEELENKELKDECYKEMKVLDNIALDWIVGSLIDESNTMEPRMKAYLYALSHKIAD